MKQKKIAPSKTRNGGEWTEARFRSFVVSALRAASRRWPVKWAVMKAAFVGKTINKETGKLAQHYKCAACKCNFPAANVVVDHIEPVVDTMVGFVDWNTYVERMFCEADGLQCLCKGCHSEKTKVESNERKTAKLHTMQQQKDTRRDVAGRKKKERVK